MSPDYSNYLAANVLHDGRSVTYRTLSRNLKVHSNAAKRMLFEFYKQQNITKAGSVHATFLVSGTKEILQVPASNQDHEKGSEDVHMQSSPFMSSSMPQEEREEPQSVNVVTLVREEELEVVKAELNIIRSIHIYSLQPNTIQNLQILSDCTREIVLSSAKEDPLIVGKQYGIIQNPRVKRRTRQRPVSVPLVPSATTINHDQAILTKVELGNDSSKGAVEPNVQEPKSQIKPQRQMVTPTSSANKPPRVKREVSDIFRSFSKPQAKLSRENSDSSKGASLAPTTSQPEQQNTEEDEPMKDASDDEEQEDDFVMVSKQEKTTNKTSRAEREEQLRKLMEEEEEDEPIVTPVAESLNASQASQPIDAAETHEESPAEGPAVISGGRRRGRRKVMKKKMLKDEEGYLVTKEEPAWESFSEEEPVPSKAKGPSSTAAAAAKSKKSSGKPGQGSIMSFFGKK